MQKWVGHICLLITTPTHSGWFLRCSSRWITNRSLHTFMSWRTFQEQSNGSVEMKEMKDRTTARQEMADPISVMFSLTALMPPTCDPGNLDWGNSIAGRLVVMKEYVINIEHLVGPTVHCENKADGLNPCVCSREVQDSYFNLLLHYLWFFRLALAVRKRASVTRRVSTSDVPFIITVTALRSRGRLCLLYWQWISLAAPYQAQQTRPRWHLIFIAVVILFYLFILTSLLMADSLLTNICFLVSPGFPSAPEAPLIRGDFICSDEGTHLRRAHLHRFGPEWTGMKANTCDQNKKHPGQFWLFASVTTLRISSLIQTQLVWIFIYHCLDFPVILSDL